MLWISRGAESEQDEAPIESFMTGETYESSRTLGGYLLTNGEILLPHRGANHRGEALVSAINVNEGKITCGNADGEISSSMTTLEKRPAATKSGL